jgi:hypothetical protein
MTCENIYYWRWFYCQCKIDVEMLSFWLKVLGRSLVFACFGVDWITMLDKDHKILLPLRG